MLNANDLPISSLFCVALLCFAFLVCSVSVLGNRNLWAEKERERDTQNRIEQTENKDAAKKRGKKRKRNRRRGRHDNRQTEEENAKEGGKEGKKKKRRKQTLKKKRKRLDVIRLIVYTVVVLDMK